ncbi:hypothetical protein [Aureispira anguillae]|uniref:Lipoprotein n=1 Tax=Aureispira anguillae TaxID=2864201 RepID=A0A916DQK7_9BACT|nr:hypothetical protein [Aureispira anguillae]BDS10776.1 hypothetical protein AsAng_0014850 [Aureispira anguillae]
MKKLSLITFCIYLLLIVACKKENCRDSRLGSYDGDDPTYGTITCVLDAGESEKALSVTFNVVGQTVTLSGELNADCSTISIPNQKIGTNYFSGVFSLDGTKLTGSLILNATAFPFLLSK